MNTPTFVYLPTTRRYLNLANVVEVSAGYGVLRVRTTAPDGRQHYDGEAYSPDHYIAEVVEDSADGLALTDALAALLVPCHEEVTK